MSEHIPTLFLRSKEAPILYTSHENAYMVLVKLIPMNIKSVWSPLILCLNMLANYIRITLKYFPALTKCTFILQS